MIRFPMADQPSITLPSNNPDKLQQDVRREQNGFDVDSFQLMRETMFAKDGGWEMVHPEILPYFGAQ